MTEDYTPLSTHGKPLHGANARRRRQAHRRRRAHAFDRLASVMRAYRVMAHRQLMSLVYGS